MVRFLRNHIPMILGALVIVFASYFLCGIMETGSDAHLPLHETSCSELVLMSSPSSTQSLLLLVVAQLAAYAWLGLSISPQAFQILSKDIDRWIRKLRDHIPKLFTHIDQLLRRGVLNTKIYSSLE